MKYEDMTKPYSAGTKDFRTAIKATHFLFVIFLLSRFTVFGQVPINGFGRVSEIDLGKKFTKFVPVSFNDDAYTDLLLYNTNSGLISTFAGKEALTFQSMYSGFIASKMSATAYVNKSISGEMVFISSKQKSYGTLQLSKAGIPVLKNVNQVDYFPGRINVVSGKHNQGSIAIINGSGQSGITTFSPDGVAHKYKSIIQNGIFPELTIGDYNTDSYTDICTYDIKNDAISIFYNNSKNSFRFSKILPVNGSLGSLQTFDLNSDGNPEIIYSTENGISILIGDSVHSYNTVKMISIGKPVSQMCFSDFNRDGKIDIAYTVQDCSGVTVLLHKENFLFYPPVTYSEDRKVIAIAPFYSKFTNALALLTNDGKMVFIHHVTTFAKSFNFAASTNNILPFFSDIGNDGIEDIGIVDNYNDLLKLYIRNKVGIPGLLYEVPLFRPGNAVLVVDKDKLNKSFFIFEQKSGKVQIVNTNFHSFVSVRSELNLGGTLLAYGQTDFNGKKTITCILKNGRDIFSKQIESDTILSIRKITSIASGEMVAQVSVLRNGDVVFIGVNADTIKWQLFSTVKKEMQNIYRVIDAKKNYLTTYCYDFLNSGKEQLLILMKNGNKIQSYLSFLNG
ncbi:MAG: VCBS repeat-containing protein, partial [Ignavibacteriales bacterium]|nr:VCBS repeat-containing protein [Ignavibacteriales bacterium]